jgi:peptidoglycan/LPS O-acetylase OafA/YrhL
LFTNAPGMAVPASIIAGIGGILYYQNRTSDFASWSYMWTLIPGFVGVGSILAGLLGENTRRNLGHGLRLLVTSAVLFLIFATFFGGLSILGDYGLPVVLILLGVYVLARGFMRGGRRDSNEA